MMTPGERQFVEDLRAAEIHWFFVQGSQAARANLWLPAVVSLLTGIENSIRVTARQLDGQDLGADQELGPTLSNPLLRRATERGMPISELAFPGEIDFGSKLAAREPYVEVVRVRHNLCHGNVLGWINRELGPTDLFFTPECLMPLTSQLLGVVGRWVPALGAYRKQLGL